jgi:hypothetical protein
VDVPEPRHTQLGQPEYDDEHPGRHLRGHAQPHRELHGGAHGAQQGAQCGVRDQLAGQESPDGSEVVRGAAGRGRPGRCGGPGTLPGDQAGQKPALDGGARDTTGQQTGEKDGGEVHGRRSTRRQGQWGWGGPAGRRACGVGAVTRGWRDRLRKWPVGNRPLPPYLPCSIFFISAISAVWSAITLSARVLDSLCFPPVC